MSTLDPKLEADSAYWITKKLYLCRIPYIQTLSPEYIAYFGMPDSGDEQVNQQMRNELIDVRITIGQMAEYFATGTQLSIPDPRTTKEIYERILQHLRNWKYEIEHRMHPGEVPAEDLVKLDQFAAALYPHAKPFFEQDFVRSHFVRQMNSMLQINRSSIMKQVRKAADEQGKPKKEQKHESYTDVFLAQHRAKGGTRWR